MKESKPTTCLPLWTIKYIPSSGGLQTASDVESKDLPWFIARTKVQELIMQPEEQNNA